MGRIIDIQDNKSEFTSFLDNVYSWGANIFIKVTVNVLWWVD